VLLATLLLAQSAWAQDTELQLREPKMRARHEQRVGIVLGAASALLTGVGVGLVARPIGPQGGATGIGLAAGGAALAVPALCTLLYGVGRAHALHRASAGGLDHFDDVARIQEVAGTMVTIGGIAVAVAGGLVLAINAGQHDAMTGGRTSGWTSGVALSAIGGAGGLAGSMLWSYASGVRRGINDARAATVAWSATGLSGTF
jgi:hypothetical protein